MSESEWKRPRPTPEEVVDDSPWSSLLAPKWSPKPSKGGYNARARSRYRKKGQELERDWNRKGDEINAELMTKGTPPVGKAYTVAKGGCWEWNGYISPLGYGYVYGHGAHRLIYSYYKADIPKGSVLMHKCDNRRCVNPDHLEPGTQQDNVADMYAKRRGKPFGQDQKLTAAQRDFIASRYREGETASSLAKEFGVTTAYVSAIGGPRQPGTRRTKLTKDDQRAIAQRYKNGESSVDLAAEYGVARSRISQLNTKYNKRPPDGST